MRNNLARVKLDEHRAVCFNLFDRDRKAEVIEEEELQLKVVELGKRQAADLRQSLLVFRLG